MIIKYKRKTLIGCLFDLDGTIIDSHRMGVRSMEFAFSALYGWDKPLEGVLIAGRTDRRIFRDVYIKFCKKLPPSQIWEKEVKRFEKRYTQHLKELLTSTPASPLPGFPEILSEIVTYTGMKPGLATGNFKRGAKAKLLAAGIPLSLFGFGSFGCETENRADLVKLAAGRASAITNCEIQFVVIGDTPEDLNAAREAGFKCALIATGPYSIHELEELNPDFLIENLSNPQKFFEWVSEISETSESL